MDCSVCVCYFPNNDNGRPIIISSGDWHGGIMSNLFHKTYEYITPHPIVKNINILINTVSDSP